MNPARKTAYLEALGIDIWVLRRDDELAVSDCGDDSISPDVSPASLSADWLYVGPGSGNLLLVCACAADAATPLAADIARCLDAHPVWAWPADPDDSSATPVSEVINDRLITRIISFGIDKPSQGPKSANESIGTAQWLQTETIARLKDDGRCRQALWAMISLRNWTVSTPPTEPGSV